MASESHFFFLVMFEQLFIMVWKYNFKVLRSMIFINFWVKNVLQLYLESFKKANIPFHYIFTLFSQNPITFTPKTTKQIKIYIKLINRLRL